MPVTGDLNVTIYGGDRRLWTGGKVRLQVLDPFAGTEKTLAEFYTKAGTQSVILRGLPAGRGEKYSLIASAKGCRETGIFPVKVRPGGIAHTAIMLIPKNAEPDFSQFSYDLLAEYAPGFRNALETGGIPEADFQTIDPPCRAAALNIEAKLRNTMLRGSPAGERIGSIEGAGSLHPDRILAKVDPVLPELVRQETAAAQSFFQVPEWANEMFHRGFPFSFKERIPFGSLQLSFAENPVNGLLDADIDIDLFTDIGHLGEVIRNKLTRQKTDPYTVYVQLFDQRIFPLYTLRA